jgi:hypothetical protein
MKALKTATKGLVLGASILALGGVAQADVVDFNLYGASAQYNFFGNAAAAFLTTSLGCDANPVTYVTPSSDDGGNSKLTVGTNCTVNGVSGRTVNFRYSSKASFDGIDAIKGMTDPSAPTICPDLHQRPMATLSGSTLLLTSNPASCQTITIGASDVQGASFLQASNGNLHGPCDPADPTQTSANWTARSFTGIDTTGIQSDDALAYPFAFYVNPGVTSTRCTDSAHFDNMCLSDADCGGAVGSCQSSTINNISRMQAIMLFSGSIKYWSDFGTSNGAAGGYFTTKPVTICYRHAGSGTHATLDLGIVKGKGWGSLLKQNEKDVRNGATAPYMYFNDATSNMKNCLTWVNGGNSGAPDSMASYNAAAVGGAIGYMDADNGNTANYVQIKYQGYVANRINMRDGLYDDFFAINRMYKNPTMSADQAAIETALFNYVSTPANINAGTVGAARALTYGSVKELRFNKSSSDINYPTKVLTVPSPQMP